MTTGIDVVGGIHTNKSLIPTPLLSQVLRDNEQSTVVADKSLAGCSSSLPLWQQRGQTESPSIPSPCAIISDQAPCPSPAPWGPLCATSIPASHQHAAVWVFALFPIPCSWDRRSGTVQGSGSVWHPLLANLRQLALILIFLCRIIWIGMWSEKIKIKNWNTLSCHSFPPLLPADTIT